MGSLAAVYGNSRGIILCIGSEKSNIKHTESTAGFAGLIKICLIKKQTKYVPIINVYEVKPQLKMTEARMMVQVCNEPLKITSAGAVRTAAASSYGFSGSNAHVVAEK